MVVTCVSHNGLVEFNVSFRNWRICFGLCFVVLLRTDTMNFSKLRLLVWLVFDIIVKFKWF